VASRGRTRIHHIEAFAEGADSFGALCNRIKTLITAFAVFTLRA